MPKSMSSVLSAIAALASSEIFYAVIFAAQQTTKETAPGLLRPFHLATVPY